MIGETPFPATARLVDFIAGFDLGAASDVLLDRARSLLVDTFGVMIAAVDDEVAEVAGALSSANQGAVTVLGRGGTRDAGFAAFYNGALAHALEFDDSTLNPVGHPSCVIVPALFALAQREGASGRALLEAYLVGLEVHSRLGQAEAGGWSAGGFWLPIGHVSLLGAAAACARLLRLDRPAIAHTLGLASHFSGALAVSNGSLAKPLGAGAAARSGLEAALLAQAHATGPQQSVERPQGFADVFLGQGHDLAGPLSKIGAPHHLEEVGVAIKRYPSCYATHWGVDALLLLAGEHGLGEADIDRIVLDHPESGAFCDNPAPTTPEEARFSHEYNLAVAVLDGIPGPRSYTPERIAQPDVAAMIRRVATRNHPADLAPPKAWEYRVTVTTTSGATVSKAVPRPLGHPRHPMAAADLARKFAACVDGRLAPADAERLLAALRGIETLPDLSAVTDALSQIRRAHATKER
jgi:2-methylcitrate dehydratase PrpD